jgi:hypothetical protein
VHTSKEKQASLNFYYALDPFYVWWANGGKQENLNLFRKHFLLTKLSFFDESKEILFFAGWDHFLYGGVGIKDYILIDETSSEY